MGVFNSNYTQGKENEGALEIIVFHFFVFSELVTKNGYFAHFFHGPSTLSDFHVIPMHVLLVVDVGRSMAGRWSIL
jgi:hypothetical protein